MEVSEMTKCNCSIFNVWMKSENLAQKWLENTPL